MSEALDVTDRTLRTWKKKGGKSQASGRKPHAVRLGTIKQIVREWRRQGKPGWRPITQSLTSIPVRLVQSTVAKLKKRNRKRQSQAHSKSRISIIVHEPKTFIAMDGATVEKGHDLLIIKDRANLEIRAKQCEGYLCATDTLSALKEMKAKNHLPLILCTDNGSPLCANEVKEFLDSNQIIHLKSLPHVPQHNGACENAVKDVKTQLKDGKDIAQTCQILNYCLKRRHLDWKTPSDIEVKETKFQSPEIRSEIYQATKVAISRALLGAESARDKKVAERKAILDTIESFGLITITRGGKISQVRPGVV